MACSRGKASPSRHTVLRLFAASAGVCQSPGCLRPLFLDEGGEEIHVAEMAHIIAVADAGPRGRAPLPEEAKGAFENLLLLCPTCHTIVDKAPHAYPEAIVLRWKEHHAAKIARTFGAVVHDSRRHARAAIDPLLAENRAIFDRYGPLQEYRHNPESELARVWQRNVRGVILPNNRKILNILDTNRGLLFHSELAVLERFRQHVGELEVRHVGDEPARVVSLFPAEMAHILIDDNE